MTALDVLTEGFERVRDGVREAADGLSAEQLEARPDEDANSIGWLLWHTSRVQDAQMAALAESEEVWLTEGWADSFGLSLAPSDTGYGHDHDQVAAVRGSPRSSSSGTRTRPSSGPGRSSQASARLISRG